VQLSNTTNSLAVIACFRLITERPQLPVFEDGLNPTPHA
jgi:hypothetical protein